jgi:hypothetical protein
MHVWLHKCNCEVKFKFSFTILLASIKCAVYFYFYFLWVLIFHIILLIQDCIKRKLPAIFSPYYRFFLGILHYFSHDLLLYDCFKYSLSIKCSYTSSKWLIFLVSHQKWFWNHLINDSSRNHQNEFHINLKNEWQCTSVNTNLQVNFNKSVDQKDSLQRTHFWKLINLWHVINHISTNGINRLITLKVHQWLNFVLPQDLVKYQQCSFRW